MTLRSISAATTPAAPGQPVRAAASASASVAPVDRVQLGASSSPSAPEASARVDGVPSWAWGRKGHEIVPTEAALALPDTMPAFFVKNADRLAALGSQPDRWRFKELKHLAGANIPDHYMNLEPVRDKDLPTDRYAYARMIQDSGLERGDSGPQYNGTLPYRIAELFEGLVAEFALYRMELERTPDGSTTAFLRQLEENAIYTAGILSHYVADATQPLHATVHHDGWDEKLEPNPEKFRTKPGVHREFEVFLVNEGVKQEEVRKRIPAAQVFEGDPLALGVDLVKESNGLVKRLYRLESEGKLNPWRPHPEGVELATDRLARSAQVLRDLWYSAWVRSEAIAQKERDGKHQDHHDGFLLAR